VEKRSIKSKTCGGERFARGRKEILCLSFILRNRGGQKHKVRQTFDTEQVQDPKIQQDQEGAGRLVCVANAGQFPLGKSS